MIQNNISHLVLDLEKKDYTEKEYQDAKYLTYNGEIIIIEDIIKIEVRLDLNVDLGEFIYVDDESLKITGIVYIYAINKHSINCLTVYKIHCYDIAEFDRYKKFFYCLFKKRYLTEESKENGKIVFDSYFVK